MGSLSSWVEMLSSPRGRRRVALTVCAVMLIITGVLYFYGDRVDGAVETVTTLIPATSPAPAAPHHW